MMKRRHFLQFTGSTLATLGLSHYNIFEKGNRYAQVLAQDTPRKLALLVGINYPNNPNLNSLNGCVTDVDLQQELLIHRFGFKQNDILRLTTDESVQKQPTRSNILTAFEEHLIKQAKPGDVVVFHFSGHGYRLRDPNPIKSCSNQQLNDEYNSTLVPVDDTLNGFPQDIMGRNLFLLMSALKTNNVTVVLDSCFSGGGTRRNYGNYTVRSAIRNNLEIDKAKPSPEEIAYQKRWMKQLQISEMEFANRRCAGVAKGVILAAAQRDEEALDAPFDGFYAGAFTYMMTQYLWQETDTVGKMMSYIVPKIQSQVHNSPLAEGEQNQPVYFIDKKLLSTDAVITGVAGNQVSLWLGGLNHKSLETFNQDATFSVVNKTGQTRGKLKLESRDGLKARAKLVDKGDITSLKPGMRLQESSRMIPANLHLTVGLDSSLGDEISIAEQELSGIYRIKPVAVQSVNIPYPGGVEFILSRMTEEYLQILQQRKVENLPVVGTIGLFTEGLQFVPQSFGEKEESIEAAVCRLEPKLKSFLATRLVEMTLNVNSSQLDVEVSMNLVEQPNQTFANISTLKARNNRPQFKPIYPEKKLPLNTLFQFQVKNNSFDHLYVAMLLIDSTGGLTVIFPYQWTGDLNKKTMLASKDTLIIGEPQKLKLQAVEKGFAEALIIASITPLDKAVYGLKRIEQELNIEKQNQKKCLIDKTRGSEVIGDLLNGLSGQRSLNRAQTSAVETSHIATLSFSFEVG